MIRAFYNDNDDKCCAWLSDLMDSGLITAGTIDNRSIDELSPNDLNGYDRVHFFAGIAGWEVALNLADWGTRKVWSASLPCQPWSTAGEGAGAADSRNLWPAFFRLVRELKPELIFGEQVEAAIKLGWLDGISSDLEAAGYAVGAIVLPAACVGAPHPRHRIFWVADAASSRREGANGEGCGLGNTDERGLGAGSGQQVRLVTASGEPCRLSDAESERRGETRADSERCAERSAGTGERVEHAGRSGREERERAAISVRPQLRSAPNSGAWSDYRIIRFTDGKTRRIESRTEPLVTGFSKGMVRMRDPSAPLHPAEARAMRLHGYGNSIVPEVAAEFIRAYLETRRTTLNI